MSIGKVARIDQVTVWKFTHLSVEQQVASMASLKKIISYLTGSELQLPRVTTQVTYFQTARANGRYGIGYKTMCSRPNFPPSLATRCAGKSIPTSKLYKIHLPLLTETDLFLSQSHVNSNFKTRRRDEINKQTVMGNRSFRGRKIRGFGPVVTDSRFARRKRVEIHLVSRLSWLISFTSPQKRLFQFRGRRNRWKRKSSYII